MKKTKIKNLGKVAIGLSAFFFTLSPVWSSGETSYGQSVYGGGVIEPRQGNVLLDKLVKNPASDIFVDHLGPDDPKYKPGQIITFQIHVNNPGDKALDKIIVTDTMPKINDRQVIEFMIGPGEYSSASGTLTFEVTNLEAGQSKAFEIIGKISHVSIFSDAQNVQCPDPGNVVTAQIGERIEKDDSRFCVEKAMQVVEVPASGPAQWMTMFSGLASALASGIYLRRKAM